MTSTSMHIQIDRLFHRYHILSNTLKYNISIASDFSMIVLTGT